MNNNLNKTSQFNVFNQAKVSPNFNNNINIINKKNFNNDSINYKKYRSDSILSKIENIKRENGTS